MASGVDGHWPIQQPFSKINHRKKKNGKGQKREELEEEVCMLYKMLENERKVNEILEKAHNGHVASTLSIPRHFPSKAKGLLEEIAMADEEIVLLERQIAKLERNLEEEKQLTRNYKQRESPMHRLGPTSTPLPHFNKSSTSSAIREASTSSQRLGIFETKAMHFINKAIKGDYNMSDFKSKGAIDNHKENGVIDEDSNNKNKTYQNLWMKPSKSPLRDTRRPIPYTKKEHFVELEKPIQSQEDSINRNSHRYLSPNKLSERIMKCLIFIFVRLIRTSRSMELEKSGPISRSINFSLSTRSFRVDTLSSTKANLMLQREAKQQDPYSIFDMDDSIPRDIGPYKNLVIFTSSCLDPKFLSNPTSIPLLQKLRVLLNNLRMVDLTILGHQQKLAFWINMYNACIMHGFLQYGLPSTPEKLVTLMNKATLNIGGNTINAQAIEHFILRRPLPSMLKEVHWKGEGEDKEETIRKQYGLDAPDPNITFALCCGTRSSPAVKIYTPDSVVGELEKSKLEFLQASIMVKNTKKIGFPELLLRNMHDFAQDLDSLVQWLCQELPTSATLRKSMVDCFRGLTNSSKVSSIVEKIPYDFEFQYLLFV
ncbi:uncharacterized protein LOC124935856 [Impatiens glandulifera]|uniref:uncharacterized protein LOC124935856 n=1 Tax=Impatiens glandulifera TaxID=253017 RepID=UPI001FB1695B|nr:uncharacterized protein LOC124935856 [Impatiens glandulifera]